MFCADPGKRKKMMLHIYLFPLLLKMRKWFSFTLESFLFNSFITTLEWKACWACYLITKKEIKEKSFIPRGMDLHPQWLAQDIEHSRHLISTYAIEWFLLEWMHSRMNEHCLLSVGNFESWAAFPLWAFLNLKIYSWNTEARSRNVTFNNQHRKK